MTLEHIQPEGIFDSRRFFTQVVTATPGRIVFIAGQVGWDEEGNVVSTQYGPQVQKAFANLRLALAGAGAGPEHVTKITSFIVDHDETKLEPLRAEVGRLFGDRLPASTLLGVERLARDDLLFEVEAIAVIP
jgi:enamine deaminase RidA (YjgF/YER057c/UK114 family)